MKNTLFLLLATAIAVLFFSPAGFSRPRYSEQAQVIDSLKNILETQPLTNNEQIKLLQRITELYGAYDMENAIKYGKKGLVLAEKEKAKEWTMKLCINLGIAYDVLSKPDSALIYYEKLRALMEETKNRELEIVLYRCMANSYYKQEKYAKALEFCLKVLHLSETAGNKDGQMIALTNIASLHREMNNPDIAMYYLEKARTFFEERETSVHPIFGYELGLAYLEQGKLDLALEYELRATDIFHRISYAPMECYSLEALAKIYLKKKDYRQALHYADECLNAATGLKDKQIQGDAWSVLSDIYLEQKRYTEAETMALKAWEVDSLSLKSGHHTAYNIAQSNLFLGNPEKASVFLEKYNDLLKQYNDKNFHETFASMEIRYETEKKELRIAALENQRFFYLWLSIVGSALFLSLLLLLFLRNRIKKLRIKQLEKEKQIVAAQSVLAGETEERKRLARDLHDSLGGMLSVVKLHLGDGKHPEKARELLDQSIVELRRIAVNMMPETLFRYGLKTSLEDFCLSVPKAKFHCFGYEGRLDERLEIVIYRCVQELVNNAVKYSGAENIDVQLVQDADRISLTVQDDGCGFDTETATLGMGLKNLRNRISACNGKMDIYSSRGKGTEIHVEIDNI